MSNQTNTRTIDLRHFIRTPYEVVSIKWEVNGSSGSTECEAWRGQHEIYKLAKAGYQILEVVKA